MHPFSKLHLDRTLDCVLNGGITTRSSYDCQIGNAP